MNVIRSCFELSRFGLPRADDAPLESDRRVVKNWMPYSLFAGRNGSEPCPLRPDSFVDKCVDKQWTPCAGMGRT